MYVALHYHIIVNNPNENSLGYLLQKKNIVVPVVLVNKLMCTFCLKYGLNLTPCNTSFIYYVS